MPANGKELINGDSVGWGAIPSDNADLGIVSPRVFNTNSSMGERKKETGMNGFQVTAGLQSHYGVSDGPAKRRATSARYPRRGDGTANNYEVKYAWSVGRDEYRTSRAATARTRTFQDGGYGSHGEIEAVSLYNINSRNNSRHKLRGKARPKTTLGFRDRQNEHANLYSGRPQSRNSPSQASPPTFDIDPDIPITSNWDGIKDLNEDKVYDLYRRYLGVEYTPPPRIKTQENAGKKDEETEAGDGDGETRENDERRDSFDNSNDISVFTNGDLTVANATTAERKISDAKSDVSVPEKESQPRESEQQKATETQEKRLSLDFPVSLKAVSKVRKSVFKFRKGGRKADAATPASDSKGGVQLPHLDGPHDKKQPAVPPLKVACSAEFETAMKTLNVS